MPNGNNTNRSISRRQWLGTLGLTGAALAGCLGDEEPVDHGSGGDDANRLNYMRGGTHFADLQWNQFGDQHNSSVKHFVDTVSALTRESDGEIDGFGYTDWSYDPDSRVLSVTLRDDITFWNGDQYTAEDLWTFEEVFRMQNPEASAFEAIEVVDDHTLEYTTKDPLNPEILYRTEVTGTWLEFGADVWEEWRQRYEDASGQSARDEVTEELIGWEISTERLVDEGLGTGAYVIEDVTDEYMDFVAHEDHPAHAGNDDRWNPNIENIRMWYADEIGRMEQFVTSERVDFAGHGVGSWESFRGQLPDYWEQVLYSPRINAYKMLINWRNREYLQDVNVRRAMAAALDYENIAINTEQFQVESHSGMSQGMNRQYWGEDVPSDLIDYGVKADTDLAEEYLARSDYERDDGQVYGPGGEELDELRFVVGGSIWGEVAQTAAHQLSEFGFPVDIRPADRSTKLDIIQEDMGAWDLSTETHYAGGTHHPHEYFRPNSFWSWRLGPAGFGPEPEFNDRVSGWLADGETHSPFNGKPMVFDIPADVGSEELDGETKEINVYELFNEIQTPVDEERDREIIRDLSWAWNYMLPDIDCTFAVADTFGNTRKMDFGGNDELAAYVALKWPDTGLVRLSE